MKALPIPSHYPPYMEGESFLPSKQVPQVQISFCGLMAANNNNNNKNPLSIAVCYGDAFPIMLICNNFLSVIVVK